MAASTSRETHEISQPGPERGGRPTRLVLVGVLFGVLGAVVVAAAVVGPWVLGKRGDLPLERAYGDFAVSVASRLGAGNQQNPVANDRRALAAGREAYTGSCSVCHGANGDGRGAFGTSSYPNATDLTSHDTAEKSDAQMFWIIKNGLNFTGMPGFGDQYSDQDIWSLVTYIRALQDPSRAAQGGSNQPGGGQSGPTGDRGGDRGPGGGDRGPGGGASAQPGARGGQALTLSAIEIAPPTPEQLDVADPRSDQPAARGAAVYFAQGCQLCHGAVGVAPGDLGLRRGGGEEAARAVRQGRPGMPSYTTSQISDAEYSDLQAYLDSIGSTSRRPDR